MRSQGISPSYFLNVLMSSTVRKCSTDAASKDHRVNRYRLRAERAMVEQLGGAVVGYFSVFIW